MQVQHQQHEECQCIQAHHTLTPIPPNSPDITAISDDDSNVDSSSHVEMSESEGRVWPNHPNIVDVEPNPYPPPPVIASEGDHYDHYKDPLSPL